MPSIPVPSDSPVDSKTDPDAGQVHPGAEQQAEDCEELRGNPCPGTVINSKYRVGNLIGLGGMGAVLQGVHIELDQPVAIKVMLAKFVDNKDVRARFLREARAAARLRGDHSTRIYDVGVLDNGTPYFVMELLVGSSLDQELETTGPFSIQDAVDCILQASEAIAEAHAAGIVHRDLKPANLFRATMPNGVSVLKILDFGISKTTSGLQGGSQVTKLTAPDAMLGSPHYMSPEQVKNAREVDARSDIWALGVILYELVTGRMPFDAESFPHLYALIVSAEPQPPSMFRPDLPPQLDKVILACLQKSPDLRVATVADLARRLEPFSSDRSRGSSNRIGHALSNSVPPGAVSSRLGSGGRLGHDPTTPAVAPVASESSRKTPRPWTLAALMTTIVVVAVFGTWWVTRGASTTRTALDSSSNASTQQQPFAPSEQASIRVERSAADVSHSADLPTASLSAAAPSATAKPAIELAPSSTAKAAREVPTDVRTLKGIRLIE